MVIGKRETDSDSRWSAAPRRTTSTKGVTIRRQPMFPASHEATIAGQRLLPSCASEEVVAGILSSVSSRPVMRISMAGSVETEAAA